MNLNNNGLLVEDEMVQALNNKRVDELSNNLRTLVRDLFGVLEDSEIVKCYKPEDANIKPDIIIEYKDQKHFVSIKTGKTETVHNEILDNFTNMLKAEGISDRTIETIRLFHYGDGTTDGTGQNRVSYHEIYLELKDRIREANAELNFSLEFIKTIVNRCMFRGSCINNLEADAIYFGTVDFGVLATKTQIIKHLRRRGFDFLENLHIGPLLLRPDGRYVGKPVTDKRKRNRIIAYWPNLCADIEYISHRYNY